MALHKILVVEDSELLHRMYDLILFRYKIAGALVIHAYNGQQALVELNTHADVDLIILDINMPVMSGLEFLNHCKRAQIFQHIPVIIITTEGKEEDTVRGLHAGAKGYLTKPFKSEELTALLERVVSSCPEVSSTAQAPRAWRREPVRQKRPLQ